MSYKIWRRVLGLLLVLISTSICLSLSVSAEEEHSYTTGICSNHENCYQPASAGDSGYQITNAGNLFWFSNYVNAGNATANAVVTENIDMPSDRSWTGIGVGNAYSGTFDGGSKVISGLTGTEGLVKTLSGTSAIVENVILKDVNIIRDGGNLGAVVGESQQGKVENCYTSGRVTGTGNRSWSIGGIVGWNHGGTINACVSECAIGGVTAGGLVGSNYNQGLGESTMEACLYLGENDNIEGDSNYGTKTNVFRHISTAYEGYDTDGNYSASIDDNVVNTVMQSYTAFQFLNNVASVTVNGVTEYYTGVDSAFSEANGETATITLLKDITFDPTALIITGADSNITLKMAGGVKIDRSISVNGGTLTLASGTISRDIVVDGSGTFVVTGGTIQGRIQVKGGSASVLISGGNISRERAEDDALYLTDGGKAQLSGGTIYGKISSFALETPPISTYLTDGYAYKLDGVWVNDTSVKSINGTISIVKAPMKITQQPANVDMVTGENGKALSVTSTPTGNNTSITYQWFLGGNAVGNTGTTAEYSLPADLEPGTYTYTCKVSCDGYIVSSQAATVTVRPVAPTDIKGGRLTVINSDVNKELEYSPVGENNFKKVSEGITSGGYYEIRYAATDSVPASAATRVLVFNEDGTFTDTNGDTTIIIRDDETTTEITNTTQDGVNIKTEENKDKEGNTTSTVVTKTDSSDNIIERITYFPDNSYIKDGFTPKIIEGDGKQFDGKDIMLRSDDEICNFKNVTINGEILSGDNYDVISGSIKVTLKESYLKTLSPGTYTVGIVSYNGTATGSFIIPAPAGNSTSGATGTNTNNESTYIGTYYPSATINGANAVTGDSANLKGMFALLLLSCLGIGTVVTYRKKRENNK